MFFFEWNGAEFREFNNSGNYYVVKNGKIIAFLRRNKLRPGYYFVEDRDVTIGVLRENFKGDFFIEDREGKEVGYLRLINGNSRLEIGRRRIMGYVKGFPSSRVEVLR